jgi:hypothetical protein
VLELVGLADRPTQGLVGRRAVATHLPTGIGCSATSEYLCATQETQTRPSGVCACRGGQFLPASTTFRPLWQP